MDNAIMEVAQQMERPKRKKVAPEHAPIDLDALEALIDVQAPAVEDEDDSKLEVVPFDAALLERFIAGKVQEATGKAKKDEAAADIKKAAEVLRLDCAGRNLALVRSILLNGEVRYTAMNKFSEIKTGRGEDLARAFNGRFARSFLDIKEYELDRTALGAAIKDAEVVAAFTLLRRKGIVKQSRYYKPTETFFLDYTLDADFRALAQARAIVPQTQLVVKK